MAPIPKVLKTRPTVYMPSWAFENADKISKETPVFTFEGSGTVDDNLLEKYSLSFGRDPISYGLVSRITDKGEKDKYEYCVDLRNDFDGDGRGDQVLGIFRSNGGRKQAQCQKLLVMSSKAGTIFCTPYQKDAEYDVLASDLVLEKCEPGGEKPRQVVKVADFLKEMDLLPRGKDATKGFQGIPIPTDIAALREAAEKKTEK
jgi:hypothetical protein